MDIRTQTHKKFITKDSGGNETGYLIPIYNINDAFFKNGRDPQQVYLTVIAKGGRKGPHLHFVRTGFFTCIKGNVKVVLKTPSGYQEHYSGDKYEYLSIEVPTGVPALLVNIGEDEAFVLNMPSPAWTPTMNDEHSADFSDYKP